MKQHTWSLVLAAAMVAGCTKSAPPAAPVTAPPAAPAAAAPAVTKESLNDEAFAQIKAKNWPAAIRLAQQAVALDANFAPARFNLGLALYQAQRYQEAAAHLEAAYQLNHEQVEPGWFLYLTLDALGQNARAATILADLQVRFPADPDVKQAAGIVSAPLVWPRPAGERPALFLGDRKLLIRGAVLEMVGFPDQVLWSLQLNEKVGGVWPDQTGARALVEQATGPVLIDLATGRNLGPAPIPHEVDWNDGPYTPVWAGDILYSGLDDWGPGGYGKDRYRSTVWRIDRLVLQGGQATWQPVGQEFRGGQNLEISRDGHTAISAWYYSLYIDGKESRTFPDKVGLTVTGDATYKLDSKTGLTSTGLDGKPQAAWRAPAGMTRYLAWNRREETWFIGAAPQGVGGYIVVDGRGRQQFAGDGYLVDVTPDYLIVKQGDVMQIWDAAGKCRLSIPATNASVTIDGKWAYYEGDTEFRAYRLP